MLHAPVSPTDGETVHAARARYSAVPRTPRWHPATARAALWAWTSVVRARRDLRFMGLRAVVVPPPRLPVGAKRGVEAVLRRLEPTCLERSLVLQAWLAACRVPCDVVIGVAREGGDVKAHAWLDVEAGEPLAAGYREIHRLSAPASAAP